MRAFRRVIQFACLGGAAKPIFSVSNGHATEMPAYVVRLFQRKIACADLAIRSECASAYGGCGEDSRAVT